MTMPAPAPDVPPSAAQDSARTTAPDYPGTAQSATTSRRMGVEEELLLIDPESRHVSARAGEVLKGHRERSRGGEVHSASEELDQELFRHQVETKTDPARDLESIREQLVAARRTAGEAAARSGLKVAAAGIAPLGGEELRISRGDRYATIVDAFGATARTGQTCGTHVHVEIGSPEEGVGIIDRIAPWLPVLAGIAANSPFHLGQNTGYASWRWQEWTRWPSAGVAEPFRDLEGYREACRLMRMTGAARDDNMLYFDARLSTGQPTVEVRVADACTDVDDTVLVAGLARALVETAAEEWASGGPLPGWRAETLRAAQWRAALLGLSGTLVHPVERELRPAREVLAALVDHVRPRLEVGGDLEYVEAGVERVLRAGGATRQRAAYERTGSVEGVVDDLVERTEATWRTP